MWLAALFGVALWTSGHRLGWSPDVWQDTTIEDDFIRRCLEKDLCTMEGVGATVGISHSAGYLHWRELLAAMGCDNDATHLALLAGTALGVTLVAFAALVCCGRVAAALAAVLMAMHVGFSTQLDVVTDVAPLPMLGAIFLIIALAAIKADHLGVTALMGLVGAVAANAYATGLLFGVSAAWIALTSPERRETHLGVAVASFGAATFAIAPGTWLAALDAVMNRNVGNGNPVVGHSVFAIPEVLLAIVVVGVWAAAARSRSPLRTTLDVPVAIITPLLLALVVGSASGRLDPQPKYCSQMLAAIAFALAVGAVAAARRAFQTKLSLLSTARRKALTFLAPALALVVVERSGMAEGLKNFSSGNQVTYADIAAVKRLLGHDRSWTRARAAHNLKNTHNLALPTLVQGEDGWAATGREDGLQRAYLVKTPLVLLPSPLPEGVVRVRDALGYATLVAVTCSWIDWRDFRACVRHPGVEGEVCTHTGLPDGLSIMGNTVVPGLPDANASHLARQTLTVHFPLHPRPECPATSVVMVYVPPMCRGQITGVEGVDGIDAIEGIAAEVDRGGQWAHLRIDGAHPAGAAELSIVWELGTEGCWNEYRGTVPYVLEGAPSSVEMLKPMVGGDQQLLPP